MSSADHKLIYEKVNLTQNLNTTPLDVTGLDGDSWDYKIEIEKEASGSASYTELQFNNDTTSNYRDYLMRGETSSASALIADAQSAIRLRDHGSVSKTIVRLLVSGDSSNERYVSALSNSYIGPNSNINIISGYWKNTADNISSLQISNRTSVIDNITIRIYQIPKKANLDNYDLVEAVDFVAQDLNASPIVFGGLDGDADGEYLVELVQDADSVLSYPHLSLNGDVTNGNYTMQSLLNADGSITALNTTNTDGRGYIPLDDPSEDRAPYYFRINASSGRKRLITSSSSVPNPSSNKQQDEKAGWWSNTADNTTSIQIKNYYGGQTQTGSVKLYRRKSNKTIDPVPMETLVEYDIAGVDFSAGITITGLQGDRINGAMKVEWVSSGGISTQDVEVRVNGDSGSNYTEQYLRGNGSSASSSSSTRDSMRFQNIRAESTYELWLYPKSGQNRPALSNVSSDAVTSQSIYRQAHWWNNTADELISMKIYASNTNLITGTIRISVPKGTKMASPSAIVTVN